MSLTKSRFFVKEKESVEYRQLDCNSLPNSNTQVYSIAVTIQRNIPVHVFHHFSGQDSETASHWQVGVDTISLFYLSVIAFNAHKQSQAVHHRTVPYLGLDTGFTFFAYSLDYFQFLTRTYFVASALLPVNSKKLRSSAFRLLNLYSNPWL